MKIFCNWGLLLIFFPFWVPEIAEFPNEMIDSGCSFYNRDHPFKTSAFFRGGGVKNWPNLPTS